MATFSGARQSAYDSVSRRQAHRSLSAAERHAAFMRDYVAFYGGGTDATLSAEPSGTLQVRR